jgi:hypothetical protein
MSLPKDLSIKDIRNCLEKAKKYDADFVIDSLIKNISSNK